ncbi:MAG: hypothetical protein AB1805_12940 [Nitrospirota bacterium]
MRSIRQFVTMAVLLVFVVSCGTAYKAQPLPFKPPAAYPNAQEVAGTLVGAKAYADRAEAQEAFGFDVLGAGMLPVQVVFDNQGSHPLVVNSEQTFLEDREGNLWPILSSELAHERATKYATTKEVFKKGAYKGFLGATAGALIGAAIGIVGGGNVGEAAGKGAAIGAAGGGVIGGAQAYERDAREARRNIMEDLRQKSLQNKTVDPKNLAYGIIFFPGEAPSARQLRLQLVEKDTGRSHVLLLDLR